MSRVRSPAFPPGCLRSQAFADLEKYGTAAQAPALDALLAKPGATGEFREALEATLAAIKSRPAPTAD